MLLLIAFLVCLFVAAGTGILAAWSDLKGLTIPNAHTVVVILSFLSAYGILWLGGRDDVLSPFLSHLTAGLIVFFITLAMFAFRAMGAADSKLGSAYALWAGLHGLIYYLFYMSVFGGLLGLIALAVRKWKPFKNSAPGSWVSQVQAGESKVPYGIAIVLGALASFIHLGYLDRDVLSSFISP
jgi:prepilin peptidase CpaA